MLWIPKGKLLKELAALTPEDNDRNPETRMIQIFGTFQMVWQNVMAGKKMQKKQQNRVVIFIDTWIRRTPAGYG